MDVYRRLKGTSSKSFTVGSPKAPGAVVGYYAHGPGMDEVSTNLQPPTWTTQHELFIEIEEAGSYRVFTQFSWGASRNNSPAHFRLLLGDVELAQCSLYIPNTDGNSSDGFFAVPLLEPATTSVLLQVASGASNNTVTIYQSCLELERKK